MKTEEIEHLASLARLKLTDEEKGKLAKEAGTILEFIDKLGELDLDGVEPMNSVTGEENIMREDKAIASDDKEIERLTDAFPKSKDGRLSVQQILNNEK